LWGFFVSHFFLMQNGRFLSRKTTMLSVEECRKFLKGYDLTDKQIEEFRDSLAVLACNIIAKVGNKQKEKTNGKNLGRDGRTTSNDAETKN